MTVIAAVNQDRGIAPDRAKGAAVHLRAMREAFSDLGADVQPMDFPDSDDLIRNLDHLHSEKGIGFLYERYALGQDSAAHYARTHNLPLILEVNAPLAHEQARFRQQAETPAQLLSDQFLFAQASMIVAVSRPVADYAIERGANPENVIVRRNAIDHARFNAEVSPHADLAALKENYCVVGFHGRQRPWHGFEQLLRVTGQLIERGLPIHLLVIGEGSFEGLDQLPEQNRTRLGWQDHSQIPALVSAFHVLPLNYPANIDCYYSPLKLMEAMACGVVPIVPGLGDLPDTITHEHDGLIYTAGSDDEFAHCLSLLAADEDLRAELGRHAIETASTLSWQDIAGEVLAYVSSLPDQKCAIS